MIDEQRQPPDDGFSEAERELAEALGPLIQLEPPPGSEELIMQQMIQTATAERMKTAAWYRRRVSVPLPIAAVFLIGFSLLLGYVIRAPQVNGPGVTSQTQPLNYQGSMDVDLHTELDEPVYYEQARYVVGIGVIQQKSGYMFLQETYHDESE